MAEYLIPAGIFVAVTALVGAIMFFFKDAGTSTTEERLEVLTGQKKPVSKEQGIMKGDMMSSASGGFASIFARMFKNLDNYRLFFEQADSSLKVDQFLMISAGCGLVGVILGWASRAPMPLWPVFGLCIGFLPFALMWMKRRRRFKQFAKQLPDAMELVARALRSGHSLNSGIHVVVEEMPAPISTEFLIAYEEQNLGVPIEHALKGMLKRMPNMDLKFFVTAVAIQKQAGGDLAEVLDKIGYIIRERFKIMGMVQALTGEGRISGIVLQALPICLFLVVYYINPGYVTLLFEEELGRTMLLYAILLQFAGAVVIKKIVNIKI